MVSSSFRAGLENQFSELYQNRFCKWGRFFDICIHPGIRFRHNNILFNNLPKAFNMAEFNLFLEGTITILISLVPYQILTIAGTRLKRTLSPFLLWGLGVGYVISGCISGGTWAWNREEPADWRSPLFLSSSCIPLSLSVMLNWLRHSQSRRCF